LAPGLLLLSAALYVGLAGSPALVDDDIDAAHALVAREMLQRHDFVVMYRTDPLPDSVAPGFGASYAVPARAPRDALPVALATVGPQFASLRTPFLR
jgi:hypothetical protein